MTHPFAAEPETCEHGLSADLCAGPGHYPPDNPADEHPYSEAEWHSAWHAENGRWGCPWDCAMSQPEDPCHEEFDCTPDKCVAPVDLVKHYAGEFWDHRTTLAAKTAAAAAYSTEPPW